MALRNPFSTPVRLKDVDRCPGGGSVKIAGAGLAAKTLTNLSGNVAAGSLTNFTGVQ